MNFPVPDQGSNLSLLPPSEWFPRFERVIRSNNLFQFGIIANYLRCCTKEELLHLLKISVKSNISTLKMVLAKSADMYLPLPNNPETGNLLWEFMISLMDYSTTKHFCVCCKLMIELIDEGVEVNFRYQKQTLLCTFIKADPNSFLNPPAYRLEQVTENPESFDLFLQVVRSLIQHGADVNEKSFEKSSPHTGHFYTPLFLAVKQRNVDLVWLLLFYGAYVDLYLYDDLLHQTDTFPSYPDYLSDPIYMLLQSPPTRVGILEQLQVHLYPCLSELVLAFLL
jgi:hypothetical protein